jgi:hypothetical protein
MVDAVTHLFSDFSRSEPLVSTCDFSGLIVDYLLDILASNHDAECKVTCLHALSYFCRYSPNAGFVLYQSRFREFAAEKLEEVISMIISDDFEYNDFKTECMDVLEAIFTLFNVFADFQDAVADRSFCDFVLSSLVSLFEYPDSSVERLVCGQLARLVVKVKDESLQEILEPLAGFLGRMFANPTFESCRLCSCIAALESDFYAEFLIDAGIIEMFRDTGIVQMLNEGMQPEVGLILQNFSACETIRPIEFLLLPDIVRFIQGVFDGGTFISQQECLMTVMRLINRGFVEQALREFTRAFVCLPDVLGGCESEASGEIIRGLMIVLEVFARTEQGWMMDVRMQFASEAMAEAIAPLSQKYQLARTVMEALENLTV